MSETDEPWRYRCPDGHTCWHRRVDKSFNRSSRAPYYCETCRKYGSEPHFEELVDVKDPAERHVTDPEVTAV